MNEERNQDREPDKRAFFKCAHKEECFNLIMDFTLDQLRERILKSLETVKGTPHEWRIYYRVQWILYRFPKPQPQHVDEEEANAILDLSKAQNYSINDLAFIFDRSKATIHQVLRSMNN